MNVRDGRQMRIREGRVVSREEMERREATSLIHFHIIQYL